MDGALAEVDLPDAGRVREWLAEAGPAPASLPDEGYITLLGADGPELEELCRLADALRRQAAGDAVTYVVNRNLDPDAVCGAGAARERLAALVAEAYELGATEICMQGPLPPDSDDDYLALIAAVTAAAPVHLHAFRPEELLDGAARHGMPLDLFLGAAVDAGLGSVPGTGARILDDEVRARLRGGPDLPVSRWVQVIETAHGIGLFSTSTIVYGHLETPAQQVAHLRLLAEIQDRTGGFSEFIAMPYVPGAPPIRADAGPGPSWRQTRALHAVARLLLHGRIENIQAAWPKFGPEAAAGLLAGGANDLGGLLLDGRLAPDAGVEAGRTLTADDVERIAQRLNRPARQRTTRYGHV
ncbi:FO synthase [Nocardia sp. BMG51109]|uniref:FO synthase n=1 Tax=Nocardia sp. BMG51109 TaxID=1056816 RepID=UPI0004B92DF7|nr:FO synthase [Nocardia sp. BMG51109]